MASIATKVILAVFGWCAGWVIGYIIGIFSGLIPFNC